MTILCGSLGKTSSLTYLHDFFMNKLTMIRIQLTAIILCLFSLCAQAQDYDYNLLYTQVDQMTNKVVIGFEVLTNEGGLEVNSSNITLNERVNGKIKGLTIDRIEEPENLDNTSVTIVFLIDISGSMRGERMEKAKQAVILAISSASLPQNSKVYISTFDNDISDNIEITSETVESIVSPIDQRGKDTDLYRSTIVKINEIKDLPGKKILIALSDGVNDIKKNPYYKTNPPLTREDVYAAAASADSSFFVFPVGLGSKAEVSFLQQLVESSPNPTDSVILANDPDFLKDIFLGLVSDFTGTYRLFTIPESRIYLGEPRRLTATWGGVTKFFEYKAGAVNNEIDLRYKSRKARMRHWISLFAGGLTAILLTLVGLALFRPFLDRRRFKKKHVKNYQPEPNRMRYDPITQDAIQEGDEVVMKCQQITLFTTWQTLGHCPSYPSCTEFVNPCDGAGAGEGEKKFFQQKGIDKIFNWLWFGAAGGFLAWVLYAATKFFDLKWFEKLFHSVFASEAVAQKFGTSKAGRDLLNNVDTIHYDALQGLFLGTCICFALSLASELGDSRKRSALRIVLRAILAALIFLPIFVGGFLLQYFVIELPYPSGLITWAVFGLALGIFLSIRSNIEFKKAILGGLVGALLAYHVYYGISLLLTDFALAKLISFILMGAIFGAVIVTIITGLEDFDLVVQTPSQFRGSVKPISKWLKKGMEVYIGSMSKCYVFVKWTDEYVEGRHARMTYSEGRVWIEPLAETLLNGVILPENEQVMLNNDDIIQLGRYSVSRFKYREKRVKK